eukprot:gene6452-11898_t
MRGPRSVTSHFLRPVRFARSPRTAEKDNAVFNRICILRSASLHSHSRFMEASSNIINLSVVNSVPVYELRNEYERAKTKALSHTLNNQNDISVDAVFANNEISLKYIDVYGFDYDYTLASYSDQLHMKTYDIAVNNLIEMFGYPKQIKSMRYDPGFAIRGLHFDTRKGLLMKLDSFSHIQIGTVYRGRQEVNSWDVVNYYGGTHLGIDQVSHANKGTDTYIHQLIDLFSLPFMGLLSNVIEYLYQNNITYDPEYVYYDCERATQAVHYKGVMYDAITGNLEKYLPANPEMKEFLHKLKQHGKKLFMITNSKYNFVNKGMVHLMGPDWRDLFDVIVTDARKPRFFNDIQRPFRCVDTATGFPTWNQVNQFEPGKVYSEGNIKLFARFTEWEGPHVLYFGDHVYSDLMDPVMRHGWRTGAILPELEREIMISNSKEYRRNVQWLLALENLMAIAQAKAEKYFQSFLWKRLQNVSQPDILLKEVDAICRYIYSKNVKSVRIPPRVHVLPAEAPSAP